MRILLLSAANSIHTVRWANAFNKRGSEVLVVSLPNHREGKDKFDPNIEVKYLKHSGGKGYYLNAKQLKNIAKSFSPDVMNAHYASGYGTLARLSGVHPCVLNVWGSDIFEFPNRNKFCAMTLRRNLRYADAVASTSEAMAEETRAVLRDFSKEITITPFGVDTEMFRNMQKAGSEGAFVFGSIKTLTPAYGMDVLIRAFGILRRRWENNPTDMEPRLCICGNGENRDELTELRDQLALSNCVSIESAIPHNAVPDKINTFDACCFASVCNESFGVSVVETMACERAVVASDAAGFKEIVADGISGFIVPRGNYEIMADRMWDLMSDVNKCNSMGTEGRRIVEDKYDWEKNADTLYNLLKEIAEQ